MGCLVKAGAAEDGATEVPITIQERGGSSLVSRCAVARGRAMAPGLHKSSFFWRDIVHGPPPRRREKGDGLHVTWHGTDDSGDVRLAFTTIVRVDPGLDKESVDDDIIHVEERTYVQRRVLQEFIDRERAFSDRVALRLGSRLAGSLARQRHRQGALTVAWVASLLLVWIKVQAKLGNGSIKAFRGLMRALVVVPDALLTHTERASLHLASASGRRWLRKAIRDPASATPQEKAGVLVWLAFSSAATVLVVAALFATALRRWDAYFGAQLVDFLNALANALAVPALPPSETNYLLRALEVGFVVGAIGVFLGKMLGSWMLYLMGDSLGDTLEKKSGPRMRRALEWLRRNTRGAKGSALLFFASALPAVSDFATIPFAVSGMRFRSYLWAIALGTIVKFGAMAALILYIGPDTVKAFVDHPFRSMGIGA